MSNKTDETVRALEQAKADAPRRLLHDVAVSLASFVAAIDSDSMRVAAYLERRLEPLLGMVAVDIRCQRALETIRDDARDPMTAPSALEQIAPESRPPTLEDFCEAIDDVERHFGDEYPGRLAALYELRDKVSAAKKTGSAP